MKNKLTVFLLVIIFMFFVSTFCLGIYLLVRNTQEADSETTESEYQEFTGQEVKISFSYPKEWGEVTEEVEQDEYFGGTKFTISFKNNPYILIQGASADCDWQGGDICPVYVGFNGNDELRKDWCQSAYDKETTHKYYGFSYSSTCEDLNIGEDAISYIYGPSYYCADNPGFQKVVVVNTSLVKYPGLVITLDISHKDNRMLASLAQETIYSRTEDDPEVTTHNEERYKEYFDNIMNELINNDYSDYITQKQIEEFEQFIGTIDFEE